MSNKKHTQIVDITNQNADKTTSDSSNTTKPLNNNYMKPNELRIGNYVLDNLGGIRKIQGIDIDYDFSDIQPLIITEDRLIKLGLEKIMSWTYKINLNGNHYLTYYLGEKGVSIGYKMYSDIDCKYVHQLQNLYFALTNKELTYNADKL